MRAHVERVGILLPPKRLVVTGGASSNECILAVVASIFGCDVHTIPRPGKMFIPTPPHPQKKSTHVHTEEGMFDFMQPRTDHFLTTTDFGL